MSKKSNQVIVEFDASEKTTLIGFLSRNIYELIIYRYALYNFINTNLSSRYRRSTIGFFWSLLNPLFTMVIMAIVFSSLYNLPFTQFSLYLFSGLLPWNLITTSLINGSVSLITAEAYLKKVYIPKILFPLTSLGVEITNFLFSLISLFLLSIFLGAGFSISLLFLPLALLILSLYLFGLTLLISIVTIYFRDLTHILQIMLLGLFYFTPVLYQVDMLSDNLREMIKFNPFYYFINIFHLIIYESKIPSINEWLPCIVFAIISAFLGIIVFQKKESDIIYRL